MALQTSGPISLQQIGLEFDQTAPYTVTEVMGLPGTPSTGPVSFSDFYGLENLNSWSIQASAIHNNIEYPSTTTSITLNWNQATQAASGNNSAQPYNNDFNDWEVGDLLIVATKLQNINSGTIYPTNVLNAPSSDWVRAGYSSPVTYVNYAQVTIFAKVLTINDVTNGNGSYNFSISGSATAYGYSLGFSWWRLRKSTSSGHQIVYLNNEKKNMYQTFSGGTISIPTRPSVNDGINGTNQYTTGSNAILVGVGYRFLNNCTWNSQTSYTSSELGDMNSNALSHPTTTSGTQYQGHFASLQTWDANQVPDPNLSANMSVNSGTWAWLYTNP